MCTHTCVYLCVSVRVLYEQTETLANVQPSFNFWFFLPSLFCVWVDPNTLPFKGTRFLFPIQ